MRLMKLSMSYIISSLVYTCNRALFTGIFPARLKYSQIHRIYIREGKRSRSQIIDQFLYLHPFPKYLKKLFLTDYMHVSLNNILSVEQHGFRKKGSTETAIFYLTNNILQALNDSKQVGGIFCDMTKVFDSVNHETLLTKLDFMEYVKHFSN
jgi:hypothetical protein